MERIEELYHKYQQHTISEEEKRELFDLLSTADQQTLDTLAQSYLNADEPTDLSHLSNDTDRILASIKQRIVKEEPVSNRPKLSLWLKAMVAAAALLGCLYVVYRYSSKDLAKTADQHVQVIRDVAPGTKRATLTLASGKVVILDSAYAGQLAEIDGIRISKTTDGQLIYETNAAGTTEQRNTISIPRAGEYQLLLPDGTRVWLNAATTLNYPTRFTGKQREVSLVGEAYFEVAKDPKRPFRVKTETQTVEVLGTHFNVNSYQDKGQTITTLAEGAVKVVTSTGTKFLKPGQQTVVDARSIKLGDADLESALAWKNGLLMFRDAPLDQVLEEISRWYDVEVEYKGAVPDKVLTGEVSRSANLSSMLRILKLTGVKLSLVKEGDVRKLMIE